MHGEKKRQAARGQKGKVLADSNVDVESRGGWYCRQRKDGEDLTKVSSGDIVELVFWVDTLVWLDEDAWQQAAACDGYFWVFEESSRTDMCGRTAYKM